MYGGEVELKESNIKTILKFSTLFRIQDMYNLCLDWVIQHISTLNLFTLIELGLLIQRIGEGNNDVLDICTSHIKGDVKDELKVLGKDWVIGGNINMFTFLINEDILDYTLPVLSDNISVNVSDGIISTILTQLEGIAESFWKCGERSSELLEKMSKVVEVPATMRRLMKLSNLTNRKLGENSGLPQCSVPGLNRLLAEDYRLFSFEKVVRLETEFDLTHIEFSEIVVEWISTNTPTQDKVTQLWGMFRQQELCWVYLYQLYITVRRSGPGRVFVPYVERLAEDKYKYWFSDTGLREGADLSSIKFERKCQKCKKDLSVTVRLMEGTPCYEVEAGDAHVVEHVWLWYIKRRYYHLSVLTNSYSDVVEQINECLREGDYIGLAVMYTCTAE